MVDSRPGTENIHNETGVFCSARNLKMFKYKPHKDGVLSKRQRRQLKAPNGKAEII